jgi:hypothetical protein
LSVKVLISRSISAGGSVAEFAPEPCALTSASVDKKRNKDAATNIDALIEIFAFI